MMRHLFSPEGQGVLARTMRASPLLAFDFDGTLTPIVARPGDAKLSKGVAARLAILSSKLPVAIVTGRSVDDVRGRLGFEPQYIVGNHGAEGQGPAVGPQEPSAALDDMRRCLAERLPALLTAGVTIEDKGLSISLHYRLSRTRERAVQVISNLLKDHDKSLRVFGGKLVVNVVPSGAPDKADAVLSLVRRSGASCAIFAGDDVNDEPVFATAPEGWLTVRVGQDEPQSKARYYVTGTGEMAFLLERMVTLLKV